MAEKIDQDVREAAADMQRWRSHDKPTEAETAMRDGSLDDNYTVQAFARMKAAGREQGLREAAEVARGRAEKAINRPFDTEQSDTENNRQWDQAWRQGAYNALHCAANAITALMEGEGK